MAKPTITEEQFRAAIDGSKTIREVLIKLGIKPMGGNYKSFYQRAKRFGIDVSRFEMKTKSYDGNLVKRSSVSDGDIFQAVKDSFSYRESLKKLFVSHEDGASNRWLQKKILSLNIDTAHFLGQGHLKGKRHDWSNSITFEEILVIDSNYTSTSKLNKRLI